MLKIPYLTLLQTRIRNRITDLFQLYCTIHNKVLVIRFDIRYPKDYTGVPDNSHVSKCLTTAFRILHRRKLDPHYLWVREFSSIGTHPHYHCFLMLNGNKTRKYGYIFRLLEEAWSTVLGIKTKGCICHCTDTEDNDFNGKTISRSMEPWEYHLRYNEIKTQLLYLAKSYSKETEYHGQRNFGSSPLSPLMRRAEKRHQDAVRRHATQCAERYLDEYERHLDEYWSPLTDMITTGT